MVSIYCQVEGCEKRHAARGLCIKHYQRMRRHGDLNLRRREHGTGSLNESGYLVHDGRLMHRTAWEAANGAIPKGYVVHHVNGIRTDNRLENLRLMTLSEHMLLHWAERGGRLETERLTLCSEPGCRRPFYSLGVCQAHYKRIQRARQKGFVGPRNTPPNWSERMAERDRKDREFPD